jgi:Regulator of chromosome condensation (RCC1) repeat
MADFQLGRAGFITVLTRSGELYTWGTNDAGQLGQRDTIARSTPHRVEALSNKKVTQLACGRDFIMALGLTLPHTELEALNKRKKMIDEASRVNQETRESAADHKRSNSKGSMKLRREYDSKQSNNSIERMKSPSG